MVISIAIVFYNKYIYKYLQNRDKHLPVKKFSLFKPGLSACINILNKNNLTFLLIFEPVFK